MKSLPNNVITGKFLTEKELVAKAIASSQSAKDKKDKKDYGGVDVIITRKGKFIESTKAVHKAVKKYKNLNHYDAVIKYFHDEYGMILNREEAIEYVHMASDSKGNIK